MKSCRLMCGVLSVMLTISCVTEITTEEPESMLPEPILENDNPVSQDKIAVKFTDDLINQVEEELAAGKIVTKSSDFNDLLSEIGVQSMVRLFPHAGEFEERTRAAGLHRWYIVKFDPEVLQTKASDGFMTFPGVETVDELRKIKSTAVFNDPRLKNQWHYINDGTLDKSHKAGADINVAPVWENYTTGNPDVIVGVVDGGVDSKHEDLAANYLGGKNFATNTNIMTATEHGTHVAGTIAAVNNNGVGVSGIAGGNAAEGKSGVKILSCQIFGESLSNPNQALQGEGASAIKWSADNGAVISQNSWGYVFETAEQQASAKIPGYLADAIDYFIKNAGCDQSGKQTGPMKGGVVIFAAGNDGRPDDPIGKYEPVVAVGSIAPDFSRAYYSNYGDWVDIAAPGGSVNHGSGLVWSTLPDNKYGGMQGTSMACPHVSGVAALLVSHFGGPGFTAEALKTKLLKGANSKAVPSAAKVGPLLDALGAFSYGGTTPPEVVSSVKADVVSNRISLKFKVTKDKDDSKAYGYMAVASKNAALLKNLNPSALPEGVVSEIVYVNSLKPGEEITAVLDDLDFGTEYYFAVTGFDYNKNYSGFSPTASARTYENGVPVISTDYAGDFKVKSHESLNVNYVITEPDGHKLNVQYDCSSPSSSLNQLQDGTYQLSITGNGDVPGRYTATIKASDPYGAYDVVDISYELLPNHAPAIVREIDDKILSSVGEKFQLNMAEYINDPDGEQLKFSISISDKNVLHINPSNNVLHATVLSFGKVDVSITATDSRGEKCVLTFKVMVKDPSKPVQIYPNPVTDYFFVETLGAAQTSVIVTSSTGRTVYDETSSVSAVDPAKVDMTSCPPGIYSVVVSFSGTEYKSTIVKL